MFGAERKPDALLPPQVEEKRRITSFEAPARALPPGLPTTGNNQRVFEIREGAGEGTTFGIDPSGKRLVLRKVDTKVKKGSEDEDDEDEDDEENESAKPAPKPPVKAKAPEVKKPDMKKIRLF